MHMLWAVLNIQILDLCNKIQLNQELHTSDSRLTNNTCMYGLNEEEEDIDHDWIRRKAITQKRGGVAEMKQEVGGELMTN